MSFKYFGRLAGSTNASGSLTQTAPPAKFTPFSPQRPATKFLAFGEHATSDAFNRALGALSGNIDYLKSVLDTPNLRQDVLDFRHPSTTPNTEHGGGFAALSAVLPAATSINLSENAAPPVWVYVGLHKETIGEFLRLYKHHPKNDWVPSTPETVRPTNIKTQNGAGSPSDEYFSWDVDNDPGTAPTTAVNYYGTEPHSLADRIPPIRRIDPGLTPYGGATSGAVISSVDEDGIYIKATTWDALYARPGCFVEITGSTHNNGVYLVSEIMRNKDTSATGPGDKAILTSGGIHKVVLRDGHAANFFEGCLVSWSPQGVSPSTFANRTCRAYVVKKLTDNKTIYLATLSSGEDFAGASGHSYKAVGLSGLYGGTISMGSVGLVDSEDDAQQNTLLHPNTVLYRTDFGDTNLESTGTVASVTPAGSPLAFNRSGSAGSAFVCSPPGFVVNPTLVLDPNYTLIGGNYQVHCRTLTTVGEQLTSYGSSPTRSVFEDPAGPLAMTPTDIRNAITFATAVKVGSQEYPFDGKANEWPGKSHGPTQQILGDGLWQITFSSDEAGTTAGDLMATGDLIPFWPVDNEADRYTATVAHAQSGSNTVTFKDVTRAHATSKAYEALTLINTPMPIMVGDNARSTLNKVGGLGMVTLTVASVDRAPTLSGFPEKVSSTAQAVQGSGALTNVNVGAGRLTPGQRIFVESDYAVKAGGWHALHGGVGLPNYPSADGYPLLFGHTNVEHHTVVSVSADGTIVNLASGYKGSNAVVSVYAASEFTPGHGLNAAYNCHYDASSFVRSDRGGFGNSIRLAHERPVSLLLPQITGNVVVSALRMVSYNRAKLLHVTDQYANDRVGISTNMGTSAYLNLWAVGRKLELASSSANLGLTASDSNSEAEISWVQDGALSFQDGFTKTVAAEPNVPLSEADHKSFAPWIQNRSILGAINNVGSMSLTFSGNTHSIIGNGVIAGCKLSSTGNTQVSISSGMVFWKGQTVPVPASVSTFNPVGGWSFTQAYDFYFNGTSVTWDYAGGSQDPNGNADPPAIQDPDAVYLGRVWASYPSAQISAVADGRHILQRLEQRVELLVGDVSGTSTTGNPYGDSVTHFKTLGAAFAAISIWEDEDKTNRGWDIRLVAGVVEDPSLLADGYTLPIAPGESPASSESIPNPDFRLSGIRVIGNGTRTPVKWSSNTALIAMTSRGVVFDNVHFEFTGTIDTANPTQPVFTDYGGTATAAMGGQNYRILNCSAENASALVYINHEGTSDYYQRNLLIQDCTVMSPIHYGVYIHGDSNALGANETSGVDIRNLTLLGDHTNDSDELGLPNFVPIATGANPVGVSVRFLRNVTIDNVEMPPMFKNTMVSAATIYRLLVTNCRQHNVLNAPSIIVRNIYKAIISNNQINNVSYKPAEPGHFAEDPSGAHDGTYGIVLTDTILDLNDQYPSQDVTISDNIVDGDREDSGRAGIYVSCYRQTTAEDTWGGLEDNKVGPPSVRVSGNTVRDFNRNTDRTLTRAFFTHETDKPSFLSPAHPSLENDCCGIFSRTPAAIIEGNTVVRCGRGIFLPTSSPSGAVQWSGEVTSYQVVSGNTISTRITDTERGAEAIRVDVAGCSITGNSVRVNTGNAGAVVPSEYGPLSASIVVSGDLCSVTGNTLYGGNIIAGPVYPITASNGNLLRAAVAENSNDLVMQLSNGNEESSVANWAGLGRGMLAVGLRRNKIECMYHEAGPATGSSTWSGTPHQKNPSMTFGNNGWSESDAAWEVYYINRVNPAELSGKFRGAQASGVVISSNQVATGSIYAIAADDCSITGNNLQRYSSIPSEEGRIEVFHSNTVTVANNNLSGPIHIGGMDFSKSATSEDFLVPAAGATVTGNSTNGGDILLWASKGALVSSNNTTGARAGSIYLGNMRQSGCPHSIIEGNNVGNGDITDGTAPSTVFSPTWIAATGDQNSQFFRNITVQNNRLSTYHGGIYLAAGGTSNVVTGNAAKALVVSGDSCVVSNNRVGAMDSVSDPGLVVGIPGRSGALQDVEVTGNSVYGDIVVEADSSVISSNRAEAGHMFIMGTDVVVSNNRVTGVRTSPVPSTKFAATQLAGLDFKGKLFVTGTSDAMEGLLLNQATDGDDLYKQVKNETYSGGDSHRSVIEGNTVYGGICALVRNTSISGNVAGAVGNNPNSSGSWPAGHLIGSYNIYSQWGLVFTGNTVTSSSDWCIFYMHEDGKVAGNTLGPTWLHMYRRCHVDGNKFLDQVAFDGYNIRNKQTDITSGVTRDCQFTNNHVISYFFSFPGLQTNFWNNQLDGGIQGDNSDPLAGTQVQTRNILIAGNLFEGKFVQYQYSHRSYTQAGSSDPKRYYAIFASTYPPDSDHPWPYWGMWNLTNWNDNTVTVEDGFYRGFTSLSFSGAGSNNDSEPHMAFSGDGSNPLGLAGGNGTVAAAYTTDSRLCNNGGMRLWTTYAPGTIKYRHRERETLENNQHITQGDTDAVEGSINHRDYPGHGNLDDVNTFKSGTWLGWTHHNDSAQGGQMARNYMGTG